MLFEMFVALDYSEPPPFLGALIDELGDVDDLGPIEEPAPARMRKVGGILTHQLSDEFAKIEAAFMHTASRCVCCAAPRPEGRMVCDPCRQSMRPPPMTPAQREAKRLLAYAMARAKDASTRRKAA